MNDNEICQLAIEYLEKDKSNYRYEVSHINKKENEILIIGNWYNSSGGFMDGPIILRYNHLLR